MSFLRPPFIPSFLLLLVLRSIFLTRIGFFLESCLCGRRLFIEKLASHSRFRTLSKKKTPLSCSKYLVHHSRAMVRAMTLWYTNKNNDFFLTIFPYCHIYIHTCPGTVLTRNIMIILLILLRCTYEFPNRFAPERWRAHTLKIEALERCGPPLFTGASLGISFCLHVYTRPPRRGENQLLISILI